jgi:hypothetical protein
LLLNRNLYKLENSVTPLYTGSSRVSYPDYYMSSAMKVIATLDVRLDNGCILHSLKLWPELSKNSFENKLAAFQCMKAYLEIIVCIQDHSLIN